MKTNTTVRLFVYALVMVMPFWLGSCKKDGSEPVTPSGSAIEGSWKITSMKMSDGKDTQDLLELIKSTPGGADVVACLTDIKITFTGNGKITGTTSPKCKSEDAEDFNPAENNATYSVNGNKLTINGSDGPETYDLNLSGNTMQWSIVSEDDLNEDGVNEKYTVSIEFKKA